MPKRDNFHEKVTSALRKDGWIITNDPLFVPTQGGVNFFIDLGLERIIGAEKNGQNIAVEIKSFDQNTPVYSFYEILGQFLIYELALAEQVSPWELYIAIADLGFKKLDEAPIFNKAIQQFRLKFIIFDPFTETIKQWKK
ncbi:element excision factor XisH family protein [Haliscomenobacter hydrossis]|uniref:XisH protein n=1 Tax=Haliscomenobacter hydrossis (strain ATCC 27775 / DSM 1100 / LMG 10767 / O) TaxID=760192 RepID=F4L5L4_HALH1|nr:element excision factor XisH family protein [Haliscomenobacter hydrossis]AEE51849.1 XisH protein [Haliscomenobacter hydrossis DSM 1100]